MGLSVLGLGSKWFWTKVSLDDGRVVVWSCGCVLVCVCAVVPRFHGVGLKVLVGWILVIRPEPHLTIDLIFVQTSTFQLFEHFFDKVPELNPMLHFGSFLSRQNPKLNPTTNP